MICKAGVLLFYLPVMVNINIKVFLVLMLVLAAGCAPGGEAIKRDIEAHPERGVFIKGVPLYRQERLMCGPSALTSVMKFYGKNTNAEEVAEKTFEERIKGTLAMDMVIYAKEAGFDARFYKGGLHDLKQNITAGRPLILFLNLGVKSYPVGHYIVVVGYDEVSETVLAYTGAFRLDALGYKSLMRAWGKTGFSTILITPKEGL
ncbi:MAG: hypothetical protein BMS9Abin23_0586 [Thermodesulfobacteriota bacterium]|nr:MAG: hypothetical protein BMS9Abin23_0586 [Thermodesulfobacteriota bacterium]